jgi:hypothetical protein
MPGVMFDTIDTRRYGLGPLIKTPTNKSRFNEATFSFVDTKNGDVYKFFSSWLRTVVDFNGGGGTLPSFKINYKRDYSTLIEIRVFNNTGTRENDSPSVDSKSTLNMQLVEAFPLNLSDTNLSWSNNNELFRTNVVFAYTNHVLLDNSFYNPT